jgi:hypothetical protein
LIWAIAAWRCAVATFNRSMFPERFWTMVNISNPTACHSKQGYRIQHANRMPARSNVHGMTLTIASPTAGSRPQRALTHMVARTSRPTISIPSRLHVRRTAPERNTLGRFLHPVTSDEDRAHSHPSSDTKAAVKSNCGAMLAMRAAMTFRSLWKRLTYRWRCIQLGPPEMEPMDPITRGSWSVSSPREPRERH